MSARLSPPVFIKLALYVCFTCLNICFMKITHVTGVRVRRVLVWVSGPFPERLPGGPSSLLGSPHPCLGSKEGERKACFKADLFYAFITKADLFSNVQCLNGIGQPREETGVAASALPPSPGQDVPSDVLVEGGGHTVRS